MTLTENYIDEITSLSSVRNVADVPLIFCTRSPEDGSVMVQTQRLFDLESSLFFGDNLEVLHKYIPDESVDLVYLDPPFNSNATYNMLFQHIDGTPAAAQIKAFGDTWEWNTDSEVAYKEAIEAGGQLSRTMESFRQMLGTNNMFAYLAMMAPRLAELRRVLRPTGSIYLHCDPNASHYLKILMDAVFGPDCFRNEIVWHYSGWNKRLGDHFESRHDTMLFYSREHRGSTFLGYALPWEGEEEYVRIRKQKVHVAKDGRHFVMSDAGGGKRVARFVDEAMQYGKPVDDVWNIDKLNNSSKERLGYPTQKPLALLERVINACSKPGDVVLDPFCGCGTAIDAAQNLGRRWIGIDIAELAIRVVEKRLKDQHPDIGYLMRGIPTTMDEVDFLTERDKFAFQQWVWDQFGIQGEVKKGADGGKDGELISYNVEGKICRAFVSVKGGGINVEQVRSLWAVVDRGAAQLGVFVCRKTPTPAMRKFAASCGVMDDGIPKLQMLTAKEVMDGKRPRLPKEIEVGVSFATDESVTEQGLALRPRLRSVARRGA